MRGMMTRTELIRALRRMKAETGSLVCLGCGHEHNCSTQGCAIIRAAAEELEKMDGIWPVVRGRWLTTDAFPHRVYCSICYKTYIPNDRWQIWVDGDLPRNYCPNCGADMRGGEQS